MARANQPASYIEAGDNRTESLMVAGRNKSGVSFFTISGGLLGVGYRLWWASWDSWSLRNPEIQKMSYSWILTLLVKDIFYGIKDRR